MAIIPGSVRVGGFIAPTDSTDTYATHDDVYGKGGWRSVADNTARDAIPADRRKEGMAVYVIATGKTYFLDSGLVSWTESLSDAVTKYVVGTDSTYTTIQSAIDAAVIDGADATTPALVLIKV